MFHLPYPPRIIRTRQKPRVDDVGLLLLLFTIKIGSKACVDQAVTGGFAAADVVWIDRDFLVDAGDDSVDMTIPTECFVKG